MQDESRCCNRDAAWTKSGSAADSEPWFRRVRRVEPSNEACHFFSASTMLAGRLSRRLIECFKAAQRSVPDGSKERKRRSKIAKFGRVTGQRSESDRAIQEPAAASIPTATSAEGAQAPCNNKSGYNRWSSGCVISSSYARRAVTLRRRAIVLNRQPFISSTSTHGEHPPRLCARACAHQRVRFLRAARRQWDTLTVARRLDP